MRREDHVDQTLGSYRALPDVQQGFSEPASPFSSASDLRPHRRSSADSVSGASAPAGRDAVLSIGEDWLDHYAHTYFRHVQPQWLFVDEEAWRKSYATWKKTPREVLPSHKFLIQLLLAVGALVGSSFRADCPHLLHASKTYEDAIQSHVCQVTGNPSPLLRTQASLLMLLYALHGPSVDPISDTVLLVLMNSSNLVNEVQHTPSQDLCQDFEQTRMLTLMSSHVLNELVASAWNCPPTFMFDVLDETIYKYATEIPPAKSETGFHGHLFQLRCIQSRIRHFNKKLQKLDAADPFRETCRFRLKDELSAWKQRIEPLTNSSPKDDLVYHEPGSLSKLYDYSLSILMQERPCMTGAEEVGYLVECCSEACCTFQWYQENNSVIYRTWTALMYQFRLGIMLLYCYAMTPPLFRTASFTSPETISGLDSCRRTLERFSTRWPRALVFLQSYQLLAEAVFEGPAFGQACSSSTMDSSSPQSFCSSYALEGERKVRMQGYMTELRMQHVHQAVVNLMEEIVNRPSQASLNYEGLDLLPNMSMVGLDLFNF
ncbi:binuclear zinc transcription factor [Colletotrichum sojae]|uniref:Binuclear zinc transcription factor n=1 Tax=Colletotrichum sojae TaxID=2175907 RepID=A0A8H6JIE9_9PEZI|nr:binuclear zinc transcription factor [Colletotrichum sojae]